MFIFAAFAGTAIPILGTMIVSIYLSIANVILLSGVVVAVIVW